MVFGQFITTTQFYLYGRKHFTKTGWEIANKQYKQPDILEDQSLSLKGKVYIITGANTGIGKEITTYLASKGATSYMLCRNPNRANEAKDSIIKSTNNSNVYVLLGDCGLERDIRRTFEEFLQNQREITGNDEVSLDGVICNAGALMNERTVTDEGLEVTFASHLLFGTYLLGQLAMPYLQRTPNSRFIAVSSGGMYNTKFPSWEDATSLSSKKYDGQFAYAYAKRGQVLLCEEWAKLYPEVKIITAHPGWTLTEGVDAAYGESKSYLEPLRSLWQGAEGIIWLCVAPVNEIVSGSFYLDRSPQVKHLSGVFFGEGSYTKNTIKEVKDLLDKLSLWSTSTTRPSKEVLERTARLAQPLQPIKQQVDIQKFMGRWYVAANIPTPFEIDNFNCTENYEWDEVNSLIKVKYIYFPKNKTKSTYSSMKARITNGPINSQWALNVKLGVYIPIDLTYLIVDLADDNSYATIGVPDRSYLWILTRDKPINETDSDVNSEELLKQKEILDKAYKNAYDLGFDTEKIVRVPWLKQFDY